MDEDLPDVIGTLLENDDFRRIEINGHHFLVHRDLSETEISRSIFRHSTNFDSTRYKMAIFADGSVLYKRTSSHLPYYIEKDLHFLKSVGMTDNQINRFVEKLDYDENRPSFDHPKVIERILRHLDMTTRLKTRLVCQQWKKCVDESKSWENVKLNRMNRYIDRACIYFQSVGVRHLDLSECTFDQCKKFSCQSIHGIDSLRSLCLSSDHPLELFTFLFKVSPSIEEIRLVQSYKSPLKSKIYQSIHFLIDQCQKLLKSLRCLHIQVRSNSDKIFLQLTSPTKLPISYEVIE